MPEANVAVKEENGVISLDPKRKKIIAARSYETGQLVQYIRENMKNSGDFIPYPPLIKLIGMNVQREGRGYLDSAIRIIQNEDNFSISTVFNKGIKRLLPHEYVAEGQYQHRKIHRLANRTYKKVTRISNEEFEELSLEQRHQHNANVSLAAFIAKSTTPKNLKAIEEKTKEKQNEISMIETAQMTLNMFKKT